MEIMERCGKYIIDEKFNVFGNPALEELWSNSAITSEWKPETAYDLLQIDDAILSLNGLSNSAIRRMKTKAEACFSDDKVFSPFVLDDAGYHEEAFVVQISKQLMMLSEAYSARLFGIIRSLTEKYVKKPSYDEAFRIAPDSEFTAGIFGSGFCRSILISHIKWEISCLRGGEPLPIIIGNLPSFLQNKKLVKILVNEMVARKELVYSSDFGCFMTYEQAPSEEEIVIPTILKRTFRDSFYLPSKLESEFKRLFPDSYYDIIDESVLSFVGLRKCHSFFLKSDIKSPSKYFRELILSNNRIAESVFPAGMWALPTFKTQLSKLESTFDILKVEEGIYLNYRDFLKIGISKDVLKGVARKIRDDMSDGFIFTITSYLKKHEIPEIFAEYDFNICFYENIIRQMGYFKTCRFERQTLFRVGNAEFDGKDFLRQVIMDESDGKGYLDIYDLCTILANEYNVVIEESKMMRIADGIGDSLYYAEANDRVYCSKSTYLNDDEFWENE